MDLSEPENYVIGLRRNLFRFFKQTLLKIF